MKKLLGVLLVLAMALSLSASLAEGRGVQIIGGPDMGAQTVSLDDMKLNSEAVIDGYGCITLTSFEYVDKLGYYDRGEHDLYYDSEDLYASGVEADYALLKADILNTSVTPKSFLTACEVKVIFDDLYEYGGWYDQYDWNNASNDGSNYLNAGAQNTTWVIDKEDRFEIGPMYTGHYAFGATLPNAVINSKKPLRMIITLDGNELTYHIRK